MHGIVKAVPSGDSVLIMGNTGQVRGRTVAFDASISAFPSNVASDPIRGSDLSARDGSRAPRVVQLLRSSLLSRVLVAAIRKLPKAGGRSRVLGGVDEAASGALSRWSVAFGWWQTKRSRGALRR